MIFANDCIAARALALAFLWHVAMLGIMIWTLTAKCAIFAMHILLISIHIDYAGTTYLRLALWAFVLNLGILFLLGMCLGMAAIIAQHLLDTISIQSFLDITPLLRKGLKPQFKS